MALYCRRRHCRHKIDSRSCSIRSFSQLLAQKLQMSRFSTATTASTATFHRCSFRIFENRRSEFDEFEAFSEYWRQQ